MKRLTGLQRSSRVVLGLTFPSGGLSEHKLSWLIRLVGVRAAIYRISLQC